MAAAGPCSWAFVSLFCILTYTWHHWSILSSWSSIPCILAHHQGHHTNLQKCSGPDEFQNDDEEPLKTEPQTDTLLVFWVFVFWHRRAIAAQCLFLSFVSCLVLDTIGAFCPAAPLTVTSYMTLFHKWLALVIHLDSIWLTLVIPSLANPWTLGFKHWTLIVPSWV